MHAGASRGSSSQARSPYTGRAVPPPRVLVCGYYGHGNVGDELILDALLADLETALPGAEVQVVTDASEAVASERGLDTIAHDDIDAMVDAAEGADLMVLGGGGLFQDYSGADAGTLLLPSHWGMSYYAGFAVLGRLVGTPVAIYGIGVGPLATEDGMTLAQMAVEAADAVSVRDEHSKATLRHPHILVAADPALGLPSEPAEPRAVVGVSVRDWGDRGFVAPLAAALDQIVEDHDFDVELIPFQRSDGDHNDLLVAMEVKDRTSSKRVSIAPAEGRRALAARIGGYRALVGMRLHSLMLAVTAGVPVVGLAYDPKVEVFMGGLGLAGRAIPLEGLEPEAVTAALADALTDGPVGEIDALRSAAERNREVLTRALSATRRPNAGGAFLVRERLRREVRIGQLSRDVSDLPARIEAMAKDYASWSDDYQAILDSRAYRLVKMIWSVTGRRRP